VSRLVFCVLLNRHTPRIHPTGSKWVAMSIQVQHDLFWNLRECARCHVSYFEEIRHEVQVTLPPAGAGEAQP